MISYMLTAYAASGDVLQIWTGSAASLTGVEAQIAALRGICLIGGTPAVRVVSDLAF